ncbi:Eukaryotic translation initiation factor 1b [Mycoemilia scoparia]|uniref:Eukaryotic translation initiation factor 1b n=1 Tax=Mycoemilia scoparia TaxID=417184 RepID=A0A9W8DNC1_9FUNG|nr:Eukaryotic translation initiation factor 1b [Mycoemilia scoparia]
MSDSLATAATNTSSTNDNPILVQKDLANELNNDALNSTILNFDKGDPFAQSFDNEFEEPSVLKNKIHIRIQQRNGRKTLTTLQGLSSDYDFKRLLKAFKKVFACNGTIIKDETYGEVIQLQGDQRQNIKSFLVEEGLSKKSDIEVHGF